MVQLKLPMLKCKRLRGDMIELYKIVIGIYDTQTVPYLRMNTSAATRAVNTNCSIKGFIIPEVLSYC